VAYLSGWLGKPGEERDRGVHSYSRSMTFEEGGLVAWSEGRKECLFSLSGKCVDRLTLHDLLGLFENIRDMGGKFSRLDLAYDDFDGELRLEDVHAAAEAGNVIGYRRYNAQRPKTMSVDGGVLLGDSAEFGRRGKDGSGRFNRIYNKCLESGGEVNAVRLEVEFSKEMANHVGRLLSMSGSADVMEKKISEAIGGSIDFRERGEHAHIDRMPRLPWWQKILDRLGACKYSVDRVIPKLQRTVEYLCQTYGPTFAAWKMVTESRGLDFLAVIDEITMMNESRVNAAWVKRRDIEIDVERLGVSPARCRWESRE
jgi:hypothetical protein